MIRGIPACFLILALLLSPLLSAEDQTAPTGSGRELTERVAHARDAVMPYVVSIMVVREDHVQGRSELRVSSGSGTIISADGYVATNAHVTDHGRKFRVVLADKRELAAELVGEDPLSDIAVLKIKQVPAAGFAFARFANRDRLQAGDVVLAMGSPWGMAHSLTQGVVNNAERLMISLFQDESDYEQLLGRNQPTARFYAWIQHDAAIAPGNSGGPLVDLNGEVVGINTRANLFGGDMAFAIPASIAQTIVEALKKHGQVPRSYFGFGVRSLKNSGHTRGVLVSSVQADSPAERAGLKPGDLILSINRRELRIAQPEQVPPLLRELTEMPIGSVLALRVAGDVGERDLDLRSIAYPPDLGKDIEIKAWGLTLTEVTPNIARARLLTQDAGLLVTGVLPGRRAASAHPPVQVNDVIYQIDDQRIGNHQQLEQLLETEAAQDAERVLHIERGSEMLISLLDGKAKDAGARTLRDLPKAWIGVETQPITATTSKKLGGPENGGYRVTRLYPGPAMEAGLKVGDIIVSLGGADVPVTGDIGDESFQQRVRDALVGEPLMLSAFRDGVARSLTVVPKATPTPANNLPGARIDWLDLDVRALSFFDRVDRSLDSEARGVVVERVESGGLGGLAYLQVGDVILAVNGQPVTDLKRFEALAARSAQVGSKSMSFLVLRANRTRLLFLDASWKDAQ